MSKYIFPRIGTFRIRASYPIWQSTTKLTIRENGHVGAAVTRPEKVPVRTRNVPVKTKRFAMIVLTI
jgi:hypothetical protein